MVVIAVETEVEGVSGVVIAVETEVEGVSVEAEVLAVEAHLARVFKRTPRVRVKTKKWCLNKRHHFIVLRRGKISCEMLCLIIYINLLLNPERCIGLVG